LQKIPLEFKEAERTNGISIEILFTKARPRRALSFATSNRTLMFRQQPRIVYRAVVMR
jgi:hypothetical protein